MRVWTASAPNRALVNSGGASDCQSDASCPPLLSAGLQNSAVHGDAIMANFFGSLSQPRRVNHGIVTAFLQRRRQISNHHLGAAAAGKYSVGNENVQYGCPCVQVCHSCGDIESKGKGPRSETGSLAPGESLPVLPVRTKPLARRAPPRGWGGG